MQLRYLNTVLPPDEGIKKVTAIAWCVPPRTALRTAIGTLTFLFSSSTTNVVASAERRRAFAPVRDSEPHASTSARALPSTLTNAGAPTPSAWPR